MLPVLALLLWLLLATAIGQLDASPADESPKFQACMAQCKRQACGLSPTATEQAATRHPGPWHDRAAYERPFHLKDLQSPVLNGLWSCPAHCAYACMHRRELDETELAKSRGLERRPQQYYGKWPFIRLLGAQEPCSSLFSLANLATNFYGYLMILGPVRPLTPSPTGYAFHGPMDVYFMTQALGWTASALYHVRDTRFTTHLDYFCSMAISLATLYVTLVRVLGLTRPRLQLALLLLLGLYWARYVRHMQYTLFDYGLHVRLCALHAVLTGLLWLAWGVFEWQSRVRVGEAIGPGVLNGADKSSKDTCQKEGEDKDKELLRNNNKATRNMMNFYNGNESKGLMAIATFVLGNGAAGLLVLHDFAPLGGLLDAHACWHALTAPLQLCWYIFARWDVQQSVLLYNKHENKYPN